jgi:hypothetical protein
MTPVEHQTEPRRMFLSTEPARPGEKRLAGVVVAVSLPAFMAGLPFVRVPLLRVPAFIPGYEGALWISDTFTAVLLFSQFMRLRSRAAAAGGRLPVRCADDRTACPVVPRRIRRNRAAARGAADHSMDLRVLAYRLPVVRAGLCAASASRGRHAVDAAMPGA